MASLASLNLPLLKHTPPAGSAQPKVASLPVDLVPEETLHSPSLHGGDIVTGVHAGFLPAPWGRVKEGGRPGNDTT